MTHIQASQKELHNFAKQFIFTLKPNEKGATVVALHGELGSGKTTFVQMVGQILGIKERIISPTFIILKRYKLQATSYKFLIHIDAYRLESGKELEVLGFYELAENPQNVIFIEWAERVKDILPKDTTHISFEYKDDTTRTITTDHA